MERLTRRDSDGQAYAIIGYTKKYGESIDKLSEYEDAEEQGLLLRLPCKAGDAVYSCECGMIVRDFVHSFSTDVNGLWAINLYGGIIGLFGLSVFTTQEEAEQALARMEKKND